MFVYVPKRYDMPKWQAPVIPKSRAFVFSDGTAILSLFDFKEALATLPDDAIYPHLGENRNDFAVWVDTCIADHELAKILWGQSHRWGMLVALERHLMRTLNLPDYVAIRWLGTFEQPFIFASGESVCSLEGLKDALNRVSDETVAFHFTRSPNDLSAWVSEAVGDQDLADLLDECTNRQQMITYLSDHIEMLKDASNG
jgi:hypothetical protein